MAVRMHGCAQLCAEPCKEAASMTSSYTRQARQSRKRRDSWAREEVCGRHVLEQVCGQADLVGLNKPVEVVGLESVPYRRRRYRGWDGVVYARWDWLKVLCACIVSVRLRVQCCCNFTLEVCQYSLSMPVCTWISRICWIGIGSPVRCFTAM